MRKVSEKRFVGVERVLKVGCDFGFVQVLKNLNCLGV